MSINNDRVYIDRVYIDENAELIYCEFCSCKTFESFFAIEWRHGIWNRSAKELDAMATERKWQLIHEEKNIK